MKVLVYSPSLTGHNGRYAQHLLNGLERIDVLPILATTEDPCSKEEFDAFEEGLKCSPTILRLPALRSSTSPLLQNFRTANQLRGLLSAEKPDWVYIPTADGLAMTLVLARWTIPRFRSMSIEAIIHNSNFGYDATTVSRRLKKRLESATTRYAGYCRLHFVDNLSLAAFQSQFNGAVEAGPLPDPIDSPHIESIREARRKLGFDEDATIMGIIGYLNRRKGVHLLVDAFSRQSARLPANAKLLLAGKAAPNVAEQLSSGACQRLINDGRIIWRDAYLSTDDIQRHLFACDAIAACYNRHRGISSFVTQACVSGRPIFATDFGWIGWAAKKLRLGQTVNMDDEASFDDGLVKFFQQGIAISEDSVRFMQQYYSPENFQSHLLSGLAGKLQREHFLKEKLSYSMLES